MIIAKVRNSETIKNIITKNNIKGNIIIIDGPLCYNWLNQPFCGYAHSVHNHGHGNFGFCMNSTSHIESLWSNIKTLIKSIYTVIPTDNFNLFLR